MMVTLSLRILFCTRRAQCHSARMTAMLHPLFAHMRQPLVPACKRDSCHTCLIFLCARADNVIIAPYSGTEHLADVIAGVTNTTTPRPSERPVLAFFRGNCGPWENVAKRMRHAMVGALRQGNSSEIDACCLGARGSSRLGSSACTLMMSSRVAC